MIAPRGRRGVGLLLRALQDGTVSRAIVTGRILRGETVREALWRHLTKDLGPDCDPQLPASITPFTVDVTVTGDGDAERGRVRRHAATLRRSMTASATSEVPTAVGSSRCGFMS